MTPAERLQPRHFEHAGAPAREREAPRIPGQKEKRAIFVLLLFFSALFFFLALASVSMDSATDDEPAHIAAGYIKLKYGYFDFYREQPPLINSLSALPLLFERVEFPPLWRDVKNHWELGHLFLYHGGNDADRILFLARLPVIVLFLLVCWSVYAWLRHLTYDRWFALLGFVLAGFCPNLLAHGRLATADLGAALFITLASYFFLRLLYRPAWPWSVLTGLAVAAALLSKISALIIFPYFILVFFLYLVLENRLQWRELRVYLSQTLIALLCVVAAVEVLFLWEMKDAYLQTAYPDLASSWLGRLLVPLQEYQRNIEAVLPWLTQPYNKPQFLLGSFSFTGWWYFYLVGFFLKTPIGVIVLFLFALFLSGHMLLQRRSLSDKERQWLVHAMSVVLFIALFFAASSRSKINLGIRYVLPIYPFIYVLVPLTLIYAFRRFRFFRSRWGLMPVGGLILWSVVSSLVSYPGYLSYFNELIGDRRSADQYMIDSDLDWGQDLRRLAKWVNEQGIEKIRVGYVGGGNPRYYLGEKVIPWQSVSVKEKGYYAVSRHYYRISTFYTNTIVDFEEFFRETRYIATIGGSIYVYYVD